MGALDRLRSALHRATAPTRTRRFDAAGGGRRWEGGNHFGRTNTETLGAAEPIMRRARHAYANNPWIRNGVDALVTSTVGAGLVPASQHPDPAMRKRLDAIFKTWSRRADLDGRTSWEGLVAEGVRSMLTDGETLFHLVETIDGPKVRILPCEMLDTSKTVNLEGGAFIVGGIECNAAGERVAYWISPQRPTDAFDSWQQPIRVDAREVLHAFQMLGAGQMRGVSALAPVLLTAKDFDELTDALLVAAKVSALLGVFFVDTNNTGSIPFDGEQIGSILQSGLEPGTAKIIPGGYDVKTLTPQQLQGTIDFAKLTLRQIAAGLGVPEHLLTGDLSQATYSSLRSSLASFKQRVERLQFHTIVPALLDPMWRRVITAAAIRGEIDLGEDIESALAVEWIAPPVLSPDPSKDADATQKLLDMGLTSRRRAAAELGWSVDELDAERAADAEREKALGLVTEKPAAQPTDPKKEPQP